MNRTIDLDHDPLDRGSSSGPRKLVLPWAQVEYVQLRPISLATR